MFGEEVISPIGNLVQGFTVKQIQQLTKTDYSLNNNGGLFAHKSIIDSVSTKP